MERKRVIIIGAAGRDFHDFNVMFREKKEYDVVAFTANQIPGISGRLYPKELSGSLYPNGIRIYDESELPELIKELKADICIMAYSDLSYPVVMDKASLVNSLGADFWLVAPEHAMIRSKRPVVSVCGVRTGVGKSQTTRYVAKLFRKAGLTVGIIRHPMPYGVLKDEKVERFSSLKDLDRYKTTIEEREDYEPHIKNGFTVYAGVDYEPIIRLAEKESDVILWDGGNNDAPFIKPDLQIVVADPLRAGNELSYYPGSTVARTADIIVINKVNSALKEDVERVRDNLETVNKKALIVLADSAISADNPRLIKGRKVLLVEDGPTITHGGMLFGAATVAAREYGAGEIVDPHRWAVGTIKETYSNYPRIKNELPAVGYSIKQIKDLEATINAVDCDVVISATPTDLRRLVAVNKPIVQISYELAPKGKELDDELKSFISKHIK